ncbi:MAG: hypothetical protein ACXWPM_00040 [Bdellovibrionota bacterium]
MAAKRFADRAFIEINGFDPIYLKTANMSRNQALTRAEHMSRNRRSSGFKQGNLGVKVALSLDIPSDRALLDVALADPSKDVNLVFEAGGERYTCKDGAEADMTLHGAVGDAGKDLNLEFLDCVNENGSAVNVDFSLG